MFNNCIILASDHSGLELKNKLCDYIKLNIKDYEIIDVGPYYYDKDDDYPDFIKKANSEVIKRKGLGIYCCASGIGVSMVANRNREIRAVNAYIKEHALFARLHEDANVLCFGQKYVDFDFAIEALKIFMTTKFDGGSHLRRINKY